MRLGYHYHVPGALGEDGRIRTPGYQGRFLDALAAGSNQLVCFLHSPTESEMSRMDYTCQARNMEYVHIGPHVSVPLRLLRSRQTAVTVRVRCADLDALLVRGPSPLLPTFARATDRTPLALLLVGDYVAGIKDLVQPWWRKQLIKLWIHWNTHQQVCAAQRAITLVNSHELYRKLLGHVPALHEVRTTALTMADFFVREDTCVSRPIRLLYSGRLTKAKGLLEIVKALADIVQRGMDARLHLVGWPEPGENIVDEIKRLSNVLGIENRIVFEGYKALGTQLFALYKSADVFVVASLHSEGFPRAIWEALAHGLPVIAAKVGSIPIFLEDRETALLVEPRNVQGLASAMLEVVVNGPLRRRLIANGQQLAQQQTLEILTPKLLAAIESWISLDAGLAVK